LLPEKRLPSIGKFSALMQTGHIGLKPKSKEKRILEEIHQTNAPSSHIPQRVPCLFPPVALEATSFVPQK
jgi:hypothetical protein